MNICADKYINVLVIDEEAIKSHCASREATDVRRAIG